MSQKARKYEGHKIGIVERGSIAEEMGVEPGDILLYVNGNEVEDIFDYRYMINEEYLTVVIRKSNGEEWELEIEKEYEDDLGIDFDNPLMDEYRSCSNKCIFCFIDQMPKGMRDTLYFKDDDSRLSFLQGNYVTLTNMSDHDVDRIIHYHLEPINISFQTMNPQLRCKMLNNRFAGDALKKAERLRDAGVEMNGQIVLCKGVNDKEELEYSLSELEKYIPALKSISIVPVGLSKFREGLYPLEPFTAEDSRELISQVKRWQDHFMEKYGAHIVQASDEWYITAGEPLPEAEIYDGYLQLENGVGMITLLREEFREALDESVGDKKERKVTIATGKIAGPVLRELASELKEKYPSTDVEVIMIDNKFFGERITVSGLITGTDLKEQLAGRDLGQRLLLPTNMLRSGENVFLDDVTVGEVENSLQTPIVIVESSGQNLLDAILE